MADRKGWNTLSPGYRQRLQRAGISQSDYESGASIQKARGHEKTPERPGIIIDRERYPDYARRYENLLSAVDDRKRQLFGGGRYWSDARSWKNLTEGRPSMRMLEWALQASAEEMVDAIRENPAQFRWLGYH